MSREQTPGNPTEKARSRFNELWNKSIMPVYGGKDTPTAHQKALAVLTEEFKKIPLPIPTINLLEGTEKQKPRISRIPGLELGTSELPIKGGRRRVLTLVFLPNPTPRFQLFEAHETSEGKKALEPVSEGNHQEIFEAKPPAIQRQMLKKTLWNICLRANPI
ncbi:MAG: hypothetical protein HYU49_01385 [Candidatus Levybacteria bacterium]|nr:hypothetical protein [Candidatus Levybacteria bacterium]MBI2190174.1 hypothetical protein [Candidatus Levybacteria bacterium]